MVSQYKLKTVNKCFRQLFILPSKRNYLVVELAILTLRFKNLLWTYLVYSKVDSMKYYKRSHPLSRTPNAINPTFSVTLQYVSYCIAEGMMD